MGPKGHSRSKDMMNYYQVGNREYFVFYSICTVGLGATIKTLHSFPLSWPRNDPFKVIKGPIFV